MAKDSLVLGSKTIKKIFYTLILIFSFCSFLGLFKINLTQAAHVNVSAFVESKASKTESTIESSATELTADKKAFCTITVTIVDKDGNPMENIKVVLKSNRGFIDTVIASSTYEGNGTQSRDEQYSAESYTNVDGKAYFKIKTDTAGKATFTAFVDNALTLADSVSINFIKPPTQTPVSVIVTVPPMFGIPAKTITLFNPDQQNTRSNDALVEQGAELQIPFWLFVLACVFVVSQPILLIIVIVQIIGYRKRDKKIMAQQKAIIKEEKSLEAKVDSNNNLPDTHLR